MPDVCTPWNTNFYLKIGFLTINITKLASLAAALIRAVRLNQTRDLHHKTIKPKDTHKFLSILSITSNTSFIFSLFSILDE